MNCQILAVLDTAATVAEPLAAAPLWFAEWEQCLSRFRADSELSRLNRQGGQWVVVSDTLWAVLTAACQAAAYSSGLVSPLLLNAVEQAGYDRSFEQITVAARTPDARRMGPTVDWRALHLDPAGRRVYLPQGVRIDLGGIAKGWAAAQAAQRLTAWGPALVDAGGDIAICGQRVDGAPWEIEVADPWQPEESLASLLVAEGGVATSGRDYRRWQQGERWQHHIIDPRTGQPAQTDLFCVTVVAPTMMMAETAAKTALILGSRDGLTWIESQVGLAALLVLEDGQSLTSQRMGGYLCP